MITQSQLNAVSDDEIRLVIRTVSKEQDHRSDVRYAESVTGPSPILYGLTDILSCPQHQDAKKTANKLYRRSWALLQKLTECVLAEDFNAKKFQSVSENLDSVDTELENARRGLRRCCTAW